MCFTLQMDSCWFTVLVMDVQVYKRRLAKY